MSIKVMAQVWERSAHSGTELLMLLALADFSTDDGDSWPSVATLARKCRMKARNANYLLARLQTSGELRIHPNKGPQGVNRYRIVLAALGLQGSAGVQGNAGVQGIADTPAKDCAKPLQGIADKPSGTVRKHQSARKRARSSSRRFGSVDYSEGLP